MKRIVDSLAFKRRTAFSPKKIFDGIINLEKEMGANPLMENISPTSALQVDEIFQITALPTTHGFHPILASEKIKICRVTGHDSLFFDPPAENRVLTFNCDLEDAESLVQHGFLFKMEEGSTYQYANLLSPEYRYHHPQVTYPSQERLKYSSDDYPIYGRMVTHLNRACFPHALSIERQAYGYPDPKMIIVPTVPAWSVLAFTSSYLQFPLLNSEHICPITIKSSKDPKLESKYWKLQSLLDQLTYNTKTQNLERCYYLSEKMDDALNQLLIHYLKYQVDTLRKHNEEQLEAIRKRIHELESMPASSLTQPPIKPAGVRHFSTSTSADFFNDHHKQQLKQRREEKEMRYSEQAQRAAQRRY